MQLPLTQITRKDPILYLKHYTTTQRLVHVRLQRKQDLSVLIVTILSVRLFRFIFKGQSMYLICSMYMSFYLFPVCNAYNIDEESFLKSKSLLRKTDKRLFCS